MLNVINIARGPKNNLFKIIFPYKLCGCECTILEGTCMVLLYGWIVDSQKN